MLKTICKECIFNKSLPIMDLTGCDLEKPVFIEKNSQFTPGYCRHKRIQAWLDNIVLDAGQSLKEKVVEEEKGLSILVMSFEQNVDDIRKTMDSLVPVSDAIQHVIVLTRSNVRLLKDKMDIVNSHGIYWSIDNLTEPPPDDMLEVVNYGYRLVKTNWFATLKAGELITPDMDLVKEKIQSLDNIVAFYKEEDDDFHIIAQRNAFAQLSGNNGMPWFQKVKEFEDWKNVCLKIK